MKKRILYIFLIFVLIFIFVIIFDFEKERNISIIEFPSYYEKEFDTLSFKTKIITPKEIQLYKSKAERVLFDEKKVIPFVLRDDLGSKRIKVNENNYIHNNGGSVYIDNNYLSYNSNSKLHYSISASFSLFQEKYTADKFHTINNIETSEIYKDIKEALSEIDMENITFYKSYELEYQILRNNEKHIDKEGNNLPHRYKIDWDEEDNSSYWLGTELCQGIPVFGTSFATGISDTWAPIQILYTKDGIEKIQVLYYFEFIQSKKMILLKSFCEIAKALEEEYSLLLTDNKYTVTRAQLYFWININESDNYLDMIPVWVLNLEENTKNTTKRREIQEIINAETGKNIEIEG